MADGLVLCYDSSDPQTLDALETRWLPEARLHGSKTIEAGNVLLLGTKSDLPGDEAVAARANRMARELGCLHGTCSARRGTGVADNLERFVGEVKASAAYRAKLRERAEQEAVVVGAEDKEGTGSGVRGCCPEAEARGCFGKLLGAMHCWEFIGPGVQGKAPAYQHIAA